MTDAAADQNWPNMRFGIGQSVRRTEDPRLLRGGGQYAADLVLPGQLHAVMVRSPIAHGLIRGIDTEAARAVPGVLAVYTEADLAAAGYGLLPCAAPLKNIDGSPLVVPPRPALCAGKVRFVGDAVACVVAESEAQARDGADLVMLDLEELPAVTDAEAALEDDAPQLWDEIPGNLGLHWRGGQPEETEAAFARAAHVTRLRMVNNRCTVSPLEPRAAVGEYRDGRFILHTGSQGVFGMRNALANAILKTDPANVQVLTYDVGGSFGMKSQVYPEYVCLLHAARELGRPVGWCDARTESFLSDAHGRDDVVEAALALDEEGNFLAVHVRNTGNLGAYHSTVGVGVHSANILKNLPSLYHTPTMTVEARCVFTNVSMVSAYRGAGRPEANYYMERLIDQAALETGHDRIALRRRNAIRADELPYKAPSGQTYDSGDFAPLLDAALAEADWEGFETRRAASEAAGRLRGRGLGYYLEVTGPATQEMGGLRFEDDGTVTIITGTLNYGQGHAATFAQILHQKTGLPFEAIRLLQGDSDELLAGGGTGGSKSVINSGSAIVASSEILIEKARRLAGHVLEAAVEDIEFDAGTLRVAGTDRSISLLSLAREARDRSDLPEEFADGLDVSMAHDCPPATFPNGCHVAEVEIDPDTGQVAVDRYRVVDDFGTLINPMLVEGQVHGGVAQGLGQALMEHMVYGEDGQPLSGSFMDYALPRAGDMPSDLGFADRPTPAATNPLGVKGCGEAGISGALPAIMNAIADALSRRGAAPVEMPATPEKIWRALNDAA